MTTIPRSHLVKLIMDNCPPTQIRDHFRIQETTDLASRLNQLPRRDLLSFLRQAGANATASLVAAEDNYPLKAAPTLHLVNVLMRPPLDVLRARVDEAAIAERAAGLTMPEDRPVRVVYTRRGLLLALDNPPVYEFVLGYERRIEYTEGNPESTDYGENATAWTLENAVCWIPQEDVRGAVVSCTDSIAVNPILSYLRTRLGLDCSIADLPETAFQRLVEGSLPRSATFGTFGTPTGRLDVRTVTIHDTDLANSQAYRMLTGENGREQTSGYYTAHDALLIGGLGVTRRYARVWTPSHLDRRGLTRLAVSVMSRARDELARLRVEDPNAFVGNYTHHPIELDNRVLEGAPRRALDSLVRLILLARRNGAAALAEPYIQQLLEHAAALRLLASVVYDCPECGQRTAVCPECGSVMSPVLTAEGATAMCPSCQTTALLDANFRCDCGHPVPILQPLSHVFLFPEETLLTALEHFLSLIDEDGQVLFGITNQELRLLAPQVPQDTPVLRLRDLGLWRTRAHIHVHDVPHEDRLVRMIGRTKEKCYRDGHPPRHERCEACLATVPSRANLIAGELCLLRIFGVPIHEGFDGIHHGHEVADIRYEDRLGNIPVTVGIHVKSKASSNPPNGLGRKSRRVKDLYAQLYFSLYQAAIGQHHFDVLGVAIPNRISQAVLLSFEAVVRRFGTRFLAVDHDDWVRVFDLAIAELE